MEFSMPLFDSLNGAWQMEITLPTNGWAGGGAPNISANGFPNCSKSSDAFAFGGCAEAAVGPNKSTIFVALVGDDKNGLFAAADAPPVGDVNFVCLIEKIEKSDLMKAKQGLWIDFNAYFVLIHGSFFFGKSLLFDRLINAIAILIVAARCTKR